MDAKLTGQLVQRFLPFDRFQGNAGLEGAAMPPAWSFPAGSLLLVVYRKAHSWFRLPVQCPLLL